MEQNFEINLNDNDDIVSGITTIDLKIKTDSIKFIRLDLISMKEDGKGMVVDYVKYNNSPIRFTHKNDVLLLAVKEINGHDVTAIKKIFTSLPLNNQKPTALICHTIKGKGFYFAENNPNWHHKNSFTKKEINDLNHCLR